MLALATYKVVRIGTACVNGKALDRELNVMKIAFYFSFLGLVLDLDVVWQRNGRQNANNHNDYK